MTYTVEITETYFTTVSFETEEEANNLARVSYRDQWKLPKV